MKTTTVTLIALATLVPGTLSGAGCGSSDDAARALTREALIPPLDPTTPTDEPAVQVVRGFDCTPEAVGAGDTIAELSDGSGLWIEPAGDQPCHYHLYLERGDDRLRLSARPGGYLFAVAWRSPADDLAICGSNIHHREVDGALREITDVTLECAFRVQGLWTDLAPVVRPGGAWAAWPRALGLAEGSGDTLHLDFVRDSTFNILNLSDAGRPEEDGLYRVAFRLERDGLVVSQPMHMTAPALNPFTSVGWSPTDAEKAELEGIIDFSDGDCPEGCPEPPGRP